MPQEIIKIHFHICTICDAISPPPPDLIVKHRPCPLCGNGTIYCIVIPVPVPC